MIQVCEPPRTRQARRLSAEEFCQLIRSEVSCVYRPRSEVLRMLTVGEVKEKICRLVGFRYSKKDRFFLISGCVFWSLGYILYMVGRRSCYSGI